MPWDTRKAAGDRVLSGDWNDMVDAIKLGVGHQTASYTIYKVGTTYYCKNCETGAVSSGTSADPLIQSAVTAGGRHFYLKKGVTWIPTGNLVPGGIVVEGEDIDDIEIRTINPSTDHLQIAAKSMIANLKVTDASTGGKSAGATARVHFYVNARSSTAQHFSSYPDQGILVDAGETGVDRPAIGVNQFSDGDAYWAQIAGTAHGIGFNCFVNQNQPSGIGRGIRVKKWGSGDAATLESGTSATGNILNIQTDSDSDDVILIRLNPAVALSSVLQFTAGVMTTGRIIDLYNGQSAFSGYGIYMNFGASGGSFTGQFIRCLLNDAARFVVYSTGQIYAKKALIESLTDESSYVLQVQPRAAVPNALVVTTNTITSGNLINLYSDQVAFSGYGITMNFGGGGGSFTGQFIRCEKAGSARFAVYQDGAVYSYDGIATKVKAGTVGDGDFATVQDGKIAIDSTNGRIYFRYDAGWHYVAQTAGFQIRAEDRTCSLCGGEIGAGEPVVGVTERVLEDGALHGEWVHLRCAMDADRDTISAS